MAAYTVDDYMNNTAWVTRIKSLFRFFDSNRDGTVEIEDWLRCVDNINRDVKPDTKLYENLRQAMLNALGGVGVTPGKKLTKDEFVKGMAEMAVAENARRSRGEIPYLALMENAWYAILDINHDGVVTLDEYQIVLKACNFSAEEAEMGFRAMDANKNGKVELKELIDYELNYWNSLNDDEVNKGMFGGKFED